MKDNIKDSKMENRRSITGLSLIILLVMIAWLSGYAQQAGAQQVVYPTGDYSVDPGNVQAAVNAVPMGGTVVLKATDEYGTPTPFNFGEPATWLSAGNPANTSRRVIISKDVRIFGEKDNKGNPLTKINGGVWSFYSPLPTPLPNPLPLGPDITIEGIHFDGAFYAPIMLRYARGLRISGNRISTVHPFAIPFTFTDTIDGSLHQLRVQEGISIGLLFGGAHISGALTGIIEVSDNEINLSIDTNVYNQPIPPHSPRNTFGEGIFASFTTGASIAISGNFITNCTRTQIEAFDNYLGIDGQGFVLIEGNTLITHEDGIAFPTPFCPNGITAGWVNNPPAANDPTKNPKYTISHNYVENNSTRQGQGIVALSDGAVIQNNEIVVRGNSTNPGANGLPRNIGISIFSDHCYIGQNRITGEGQYAMWWSTLPNLYPTASNNVCVGNNMNRFNPNDGAAHLYFSQGADSNTIVGGSGTVINLGSNNILKGGYWDVTGNHLTTPGGVGDEISDIKDWWDLPWEERD